ncbi:MAG: hypothetical protein ACREIV_08805, partial [Planctomycetaceae bacterium]
AGAVDSPRGTWTPRDDDARRIFHAAALVRSNQTKRAPTSTVIVRFVRFVREPQMTTEQQIQLQIAHRNLLHAHYVLNRTARGADGRDAAIAAAAIDQAIEAVENARYGHRPRNRRATYEGAAAIARAQQLADETEAHDRKYRKRT